MARLTIRLLGPFHVTLDGKPITNFESNKVRALLACLAMEPHHPYSRDTLAGLLWPDQPGQAARHNLRQALSNLRQALGDREADPPFLHITRGTVQFNRHSDHQIAERLENPACRLLTLVGPGGIGKTRLALQAAAEQVECFLNGVFFVPLAAVSSTRFLPATIADAIGFVFSGDEAPQVQLLNYLRGKEMLLVLDDFEHLLPPPPLTTRWAGRTRKAKARGTKEAGNCWWQSSRRHRARRSWSRRENHCTCELSGSLKSEGWFSPNQRQRQGWRPTVPCSCLSRPPAGWPQALGWRAGPRRPLAASPSAQEAAAQRHATFYMDFLAAQGSGEEASQRAAIRAELANIRAAWRWVAEKRDLETVERVAATLHNFYGAQSWFQEGIDAFQFALDQLADQPAATSEHASVLCDLLGRQARMYIHIGQVETARCILEEVKSYLHHVESAARRSAVLGYLAITTYYAGDYGRAADLAEESLCLSRETDDQDGIAFALNFLGSCAKAQGEYAQAHRYFEQSVAVYRQLQDGIGAAMVLNNLGNLAQATHDYANARRYYRECSDLFKAHDHVHGAATTLANAGRLALRQQAYEDARQLLTESLALKQEMNDQRGMAVALVSLGDVSVATGAYSDAREQLGQALTLAQQSGDVKLMLDGLVAVAALAMELGQSQAASHLLAFALHHHAIAQEARERAEQLTGELGKLPAGAQGGTGENGHERATEQIVAQILQSSVDLPPLFQALG
jgi:tetratricopeptide (TPR) repeat protein